MSTTRTTAEERAQRRKGRASESVPGRRFRLRLFASMILSSLTILVGLWLVFEAGRGGQAADSTQSLLDLNNPAVASRIPTLLEPIFPNPVERLFVAERIGKRLGESPIPNVGALAGISVHESEIDSRPDLGSFNQRLKERREKEGAYGKRRDPSISLLTPRQLGELKASVAVRTPALFRSKLIRWIALYFAGFYIILLVWFAKRFTGDDLLLPAAHLLTGIGLILMISIRDPLRDRTDFVEFIQGVLIGCGALLILSLVEIDRLRRLVYLPLLAGLALSIALIIFGSGPTGSDAKVNLFFTQPVEAIKILIIIFLAAFFAARWDVMRAFSELPGRFFRLPRLKDVFPVFVAMGIVLIFFFLQKDLGPALVLACTFLTLYTVARGRLLITVLGLGTVVTGFWIGYRFNYPHTVSERVRIWLSPWENAIGGGIQLVHSFWAFATGELTGTGLGLGDPKVVPAVHTDLILAALGEELGWVGLLVVFALYGLIIQRGLAIALRARGDYASFLSLGLVCLIGFEIILIAGGITGVLPLSGVVSPFLSFGKSSMIANLSIIGMIMAISAHEGESAQIADRAGTFDLAFKKVGLLFLALFSIVLLRAAYLQLIVADRILVAGALTLQGDGKLRYQYNPRLEIITRTLPKGTIYDRNGIPLATGSWEELERFRDQYQALGIPIDEVCSHLDDRHYPFGGITFHLLGDRRSRLNWAAANTAYIERDSSVRIAGYDDHARVVELRQPNGEKNLAIQRDYAELIPLLRYRYRPGHPAVRRLIERNRDVRSSIDIALQMSVAAILRERIVAAHKERGAAVVIDADTGDLLAAVSYPWPDGSRKQAGISEEEGEDTKETDMIFDRSRFGIYPPGSTFKIVTSIAALHKSPGLMNERFACHPLNGGQGAIVRGHAIYDDESDGSGGHGAISMEDGIVKSCNAYFAQLGVERIGAEELFGTSSRLELSFAREGMGSRVFGDFSHDLDQSSYGQGPVFVSPFQMARVAATVANGGAMPFGRWVIDESNQRSSPPLSLIGEEQARLIGAAMRGVVLRGTGRRLSKLPVQIAGKTGTAQNRKGAQSHSWFIGFAPYDSPATGRIAFSVIVENGGYGGSLAAPIAGEIAKVVTERSIGR